MNSQNRYEKQQPAGWIDQAMNLLRPGFLEGFEQAIGSNNPNEADSDGRRLLHEAAKLGLRPHMEALVKKGARCDLKNTEGLTPLIAAALCGQEACIKWLAKQNCDAEAMATIECRAIHGDRSEASYDAFMCALSRGESKTFEALAKEAPSFWNPSRKYARGGGWIQMAHLAAALPESGPLAMILAHSKEPDAPNSSGNPPLRFALANGSLACARTLLSAGADPTFGGRCHDPIKQFGRDERARPVAALIEAKLLMRNFANPFDHIA